MRLIDADKIVNYEITGNFSCGELSGTDKFVLLPVHHLSEIPTVKHYFSDQEYKIGCCKDPMQAVFSPGIWNPDAEGKSMPGILPGWM